MQVISISSLKGGVGKTSVTLGLASAALNAGLRTLVIDLDPHADATTGLDVRSYASRNSHHLDIGRMLRSPKKNRLADNLLVSGWDASTEEAPREQPGAEKHSADKHSAENQLTENRKNNDGEDASHPHKRGVLHVIQGSAYSGIYDRPDINRRDLQRLSTLISKVSGYDLILIDCPPSLNGLTRMAWVASNVILLVAEPQLFSVAGTERTLRALEMLRLEVPQLDLRTQLVVNRFKHDSAEHAYRLAEIKEMFSDAVLEPVIPESAQWQQIQGAAHSVHQWPDERAKRTAHDFDELLVQLLPSAANANPERARGRRAQ